VLILTKNHSSPCTTVRVFLKLFLFQWKWEWEGIGITFGNKCELEYSLRFPKVGNGNEVMGMGGNGYTKVIPAHLYLFVCPVKDLSLVYRVGEIKRGQLTFFPCNN